MKQAPLTRKFPTKLVVLGLLILLGTPYVLCKTEVGWTYFYPMGSMEQHIEQSLTAYGIQGYTLRKARLLTGSRNGYAVLEMGPGIRAAAQTKLLSAGYETFLLSGSAEPLAIEVENLHLKNMLISAGYALDEVETAIAEVRTGRMQVLSGIGDRGPVSLRVFCIPSESPTVRLGVGYRFG